MTDIKIDKNIVAQVHYTGTLPDTGEVFDSSEGATRSRSGWPSSNDSRFRRGNSRRRRG